MPLVLPSIGAYVLDQFLLLLLFCCSADPLNWIKIFSAQSDVNGTRKSFSDKFSDQFFVHMPRMFHSDLVSEDDVMSFSTSSVFHP